MSRTADDPIETMRDPNISTEHQEEGGARHPRDVLDREPRRDKAGGAIPGDYDPRTMTRKGEEKDTRAGREAAERSGTD